MTVVLPPARAERDPVSQVSPVGELSCSMWTWESTPLELLLDVIIHLICRMTRETYPGVI